MERGDGESVFPSIDSNLESERSALKGLNGVGRKKRENVMDESDGMGGNG